MALRINTNVVAITAQRHLKNTQRETNRALKALASGTRIVNPGDDAAGFAISENLRAQTNGLKVSERSTGQAKAMVQVAEGALQEQSNILVRMRELSVMSASDTLSDTEREFVDKEFQQLSQEFQRIAEVTRFGSKQLLTGDGSEYEFQVGVHATPENQVKFRLEANSTADAVGIDGLNVSEQDEALDSLESLDDAISKVAGLRAEFGAYQARFEHIENNLSVSYENLEEARSRIADADVAEETAKVAKNQVLQNAGIATLAQANSITGQTIRLITQL